MYPWVVKILYQLNRCWRIKMWTVLLTNRTRKNHTKTIFASSEHLLFTCMEMRDSKKKHPKFSTFSRTILEKQIHQSSRVFTWLIFRKWRRWCNSIFFNDIDFVDAELIGLLARRSMQKFEKSVKLLRYNNHICYVSDMNSFFKSFRCSSCDTIFSTTGNLERHLIKCSERVKHIYPKNVYQLRETLFEKLDSFITPYREDLKLFKNLAVFDFESICNKEETYKETETTKGIGKHVPIWVSISSNLIPEPIFFCNSDPRHHVSSFVGTLEGWGTQSKAQMKLRFIELETAIKIKLSSILQQLNQRHSQRERVIDYDNDEYFNDTAEENELSTQFLQMQKNHPIVLQEHFERYCNTLPVSGFNSAKYDINLIKSYLWPILVNERQIEPTVIKRANQFVSFKFGDVQLLDIMNFLGEATSLDSFLKAYKTEETKGFFPYEWFDNPEKLNNKELPPYDSFFSKLRNINPPEKDYDDFENLTTSGISSEQAVCELRINKVPPTGDENYAFLESIWVSEWMKSFKDIWMWYNNKDVVPTLEAMHKMIEFYHQKEIDMLKLGCTLPNLANICLHKSTDSKFYLSLKATKTGWRRFVKICLVVPPLFLHAGLWLTKLLSANQRICANQLSAKTQANSISIRCVNQCLLDCIQDGTMTLNLKNSCLDITKHPPSKIWSFLIFNKLVRNVGLKAMLQLVDKRRLIALVLMEFVIIVTLSLKQWVVISTTVRVKKLARHWLTTKSWEE